MQVTDLLREQLVVLFLGRQSAQRPSQALGLGNFRQEVVAVHVQLALHVPDGLVVGEVPLLLFPVDVDCKQGSDTRVVLVDRYLRLQFGWKIKKLCEKRKCVLWVGVCVCVFNLLN